MHIRKGIGDLSSLLDILLEEGFLICDILTAETILVYLVWKCYFQL